jgi:hypothetical protein
LVINQIFSACSKFGRSFKSKSVFIKVLTQIGFIQIKNKIEKIIKANTKLKKTQAKRIIDCCHAGLFIIL